MLMSTSGTYIVHTAESDGECVCVCVCVCVCIDSKSCFLIVAPHVA